MTSTLGRRAARGAVITLSAQGLRVAVQLVGVVVLARLLSPHDYGLIAMVLALIGVGEIFRDFGLSSAAVQAASLSAAQRNTLFWINTAIGVALALAVVLFAPLIAAVYDEPELATIARSLAPVFVLNGLATQYRASLVRSLRFRALAVSDISSAVFGLLIAVVAALAGAGVAALVLQQLGQAVVLLLVVAVAARWLPGLPRRGAAVREMLGFGGHLVGSQLVGYVANNVDTVLIGVRFGAVPVGIYSRAFQLLMTPLNQVRSPLTAVALPVLSRLSSDAPRFARFVALGQLCLGYTLVAGLALAAAAAEPLTVVLLGQRWLPSADVLRLLAVAGVFQTLAFVGYWVYLAKALTRDLFRYSIVSAVIRIACLLIGSQWGIVGVAAGYAIAPAISWPLSLWWLARRSGMSTRPLYAGAARILSSAAIAGIAAWLAANAAAGFGSIVQLAIAALALTVAYTALLALPAIRRDARAVLGVARLLARPRAERSNASRLAHEGGDAGIERSGDGGHE